MYTTDLYTVYIFVFMVNVRGSACKARLQPASQTHGPVYNYIGTVWYSVQLHRLSVRLQSRVYNYIGTVYNYTGTVYNCIVTVYNYINTVYNYKGTVYNYKGTLYNYKDYKCLN